MVDADRRVEAIKEQNKYEGDWIKLLIILLVTVGGGTARLLLGEVSRPVDMIFAGLGSLFLIGIIGAILILPERIRRRPQAMTEDA